MKTKVQKNEELAKGRELLGQSHAVLLIDFSKVKTADLKNLRRDLKKSGNPMLVIKKRLLGVLLKEQGVELQGKDFKAPMGAIFAANLEQAASFAYKFFNGLEKEKKIEGVRLLGGYDMDAKAFMPQKDVVFIGQLPPREILLAQLLGMLAAPIRSFLYVLDQKAKQA